MYRWKWLPLIVAVLLLCGCSRITLRLATTTSTRDSGLLDELLPGFKQSTGFDVRVLAVGSGQAIELGRRGDVDMLLTHAPDAEKKFMQDGAGSRRYAIMYNDFVLAGPPTDPAQVKGEASASTAFRTIAAAKSPFVSRADDSGTHMKEMSIWKDAGADPSGADPTSAADWYLQAGSGMAAALRVANEKQAYILCDRSTFLAHAGALDLQILVEGDRTLHNPYSAITINVAKHPHTQHEAATRFAEYLLSPAVQQKISRFGSKQYGQALFFIHHQPAAAR